MTLTDIRHEEPLFVDLPAGRKFIGKRIVLNDGQVVWLRELKQEHVMRSGRLGFDAMTYDTQFAGRRGYVLARLPGDIEYRATHDIIGAHATRHAYSTNGLQVFLGFRWWSRNGEPSVAELAEAEVVAPVVRRVEWPCPKCGAELELVSASPFDPSWGHGRCLKHGRQVTKRSA